MKKLLTILLSLLVVFTLAGCNNGGGESGNNNGGNTATGPFKIGVATIFEGEQWEVQRNYYVNELAGALNMEFMFSEKINDANGLMDFIDQAYAAGCQGILNYRTMNEDVAQAARKCEEYGMYFVTQNSALTEEVADLPHNIGHCGADPVKMAAAYKEMFNEILADGEPHSIVIYSCAAVGKMAMSHYYTVTAILETFQEKYGLQYEASIDELINKQEPGEVVTGRDDVKIYLFPGLDFDAATVGCQAQLQTGNYDIFASPASFQLFANAVDEVEKSLNKDIKMVATVSIDDQTMTAFESKDSFGNPVLNGGIVNPLNPANGVNCIELYNGLVGAGDQMKENGKAVLLGVAPFVCMDAETFRGITQLDRSHENFIINSDDIAKLMATNNPNVTYKDIDALLTEISDVNYVLKKAGLE